MQLKNLLIMDIKIQLYIQMYDAMVRKIEIYLYHKFLKQM